MQHHSGRTDSTAVRAACLSNEYAGRGLWILTSCSIPHTVTVKSSVWTERHWTERLRTFSLLLLSVNPVIFYSRTMMLSAFNNKKKTICINVAPLCLKSLSIYLVLITSQSQKRQLTSLSILRICCEATVVGSNLLYESRICELGHILMPKSENSLMKPDDYI